MILDIIDLDDFAQAFDMTNKNNRNEKISDEYTSSEMEMEISGQIGVQILSIT